ncbi:MAG: Fur family transcriptional regulator [Gemmatimonadales bacterium]|nr:Fur family transcriptional regulator [Gemmatimonadales bacterium]
MPRLTRDEAFALLDRFRRYLRDHRLPVTTQREQVAQIVFLADEHLSVEGIEKRLRERGARVGTATVYRTLEVLIESGLVRAHDFGEGFKRYEPMTEQAGTHEHLICVRCGKVVEFQHERLERVLPIIADEQGFTLQRHKVELYGLCRDCRRRDLAPLSA